MKKIDNQSDHDTLVTIVGAVDNLDKKFTDKFNEVRADITDKFNEVRADIKDIKDGTTARIGLHEIRIRKLEDKTNNYKITLTLYSIAVGAMIGLIIFHILQ
jgi:hypothetical protein